MRLPRSAVCVLVLLGVAAPASAGDKKLRIGSDGGAVLVNEQAQPTRVAYPMDDPRAAEMIEASADYLSQNESSRAALANLLLHLASIPAPRRELGNLKVLFDGLVPEVLETFPQGRWAIVDDLTSLVAEIERRNLRTDAALRILAAMARDGESRWAGLAALELINRWRTEDGRHGEDKRRFTSEFTAADLLKEPRNRDFKGRFEALRYGAATVAYALGDFTGADTWKARDGLRRFLLSPGELRANEVDFLVRQARREAQRGAGNPLLDMAAALILKSQLDPVPEDPFARDFNSKPDVGRWALNHPDPPRVIRRMGELNDITPVLDYLEAAAKAGREDLRWAAYETFLAQPRGDVSRTAIITEGLRHETNPQGFLRVWNRGLSPSRSELLIRALLATKMSTDRKWLAMVGFMKACLEKPNPNFVIALAALDGTAEGRTVGLWFQQVDYFATYLADLLLDPRIVYPYSVLETGRVKARAARFIEAGSRGPAEAGNGVRASNIARSRLEDAGIVPTEKATRALLAETDPKRDVATRTQAYEVLLGRYLWRGAVEIEIESRLVNEPDLEVYAKAWEAMLRVPDPTAIEGGNMRPISRSRLILRALLARPGRPETKERALARFFLACRQANSPEMTLALASLAGTHWGDVFAGILGQSEGLVVSLSETLLDARLNAGVSAEAKKKVAAYLEHAAANGLGRVRTQAQAAVASLTNAGVMRAEAPAAGWRGLRSFGMDRLVRVFESRRDLALPKPEGPKAAGDKREPRAARTVKAKK